MNLFVTIYTENIVVRSIGCATIGMSRLVMATTIGYRYRLSATSTIAVLSCKSRLIFTLRPHTLWITIFRGYRPLAPRRLRIVSIMPQTLNPHSTLPPKSCQTASYLAPGIVPRHCKNVLLSERHPTHGTVLGTHCRSRRLVVDYP